MKIPISVLRRLNIRLVVYLDDLILLGQNKWEVEMARETTIFLLQQLGFVINFKIVCDDPINNDGVFGSANRYTQNDHVFTSGESENIDFEMQNPSKQKNL